MERSLRRVSTVVLVALCLASRSGALQCLQCHSTQENGGACVNDIDGMTKSIMGESETYNKTCDPNKNQTMCMIEIIEKKAGYVSVLRDCSDGRLFSFSGQISEDKYERLLNLKADNASTCIFYLQFQAHICVSLCTDDFCNGPRIVPNTTNSTECDDNATCSAHRPLFFLSPGPLGIGVDGFLGNAFVLPVLVYAIAAILV